MIDTEQTVSSDGMSNEENTDKDNVHFDKNILIRQKSINNRELLVAASKGDPDKVRDLIKEGADVNFVDKDGNTALHYAVGSRNLEVTQLLLTKIEDVNVKNNVSQSALNIARKINKQDIIEEIQEKILDTSLNMLKKFKGESPSTNKNKNCSVEQDVEKKIKDKIHFCLNALTELRRDTSQIKKFTHKNVNIFILFLEAFALQDVEVNNNLSMHKKNEYIKDIFKEKDNQIIRDIRNIYLHREDNTEDKTNHSIKDFILGPEYLQNFVVTKNKNVNVKEFFEDIHNYVQGVYNKLENQQNEQSKQDETNQKGLDQILKCDFSCNKPYNTKKKEKENKTLLDIFGDLVKESYNSRSEQQAEQAENIMFNLIVNIIPLIGKDFKDKLTDKLKDLRNNLVHNFHHYDNSYFRIIMFKKAISSSRSNLFKYYFSEEVHNILITIRRYENYSEIETKMSKKLKKCTEHLKERLLDLAEEEVTSLEYKFVNLLFESKDNIHNKEVIEKLVDQYFKFMIIIDYEEIEGKGQINNEDEANTFLNQHKKLSDVERREVFEDFINLKKIQELPDEESAKIKECKKLKKEEVRKKLAGYFKVRDNFDEIVKFYIEENNSLDEKTEKQAKKVTDILTILINIQETYHFSIPDVIYLYKKRVFGSSDYEDMIRKNEANETEKLRIECKLNGLPDSDEIIDVLIAGKSIQISIMQIVINVIQAFSNTYNKYQIKFDLEEVFNDEVFLNYLVSRDVKKVNSQRNQKPCYQFKSEDYIFMIIKKLINIEYMAPYIACLVAKVQNTEVIEKDDLIKLLTILIKRDSYIPYLNELLCIKVTEPRFCFYREVCNILRNNLKENIDIQNMSVLFEKPEHVKGILLELRTSIEDVTVEFMQNVLKLLNNVIHDLLCQRKYKTSEEIINLQEIELMQNELKKKDPKQDVDSIIVEYKLNAAKVKNYRGLEEKQLGEYKKAEKLYKEALELLEGVSSMKSSQSLLILGRRGYTKNLLKKYDEAYEEFENLYKELAKLTLNLNLSSAHGKDVYTKKICIQIAETKSYQKLLDLSSEHMTYLNVTSVGNNMAYNKMGNKNYNEALAIYKEIQNMQPNFKSSSTSWIVKKIAYVNHQIANSKTTDSDDQSALQYYYDSLIEYNTVLEMENKKYSSYHPIIKSTYKYICNLLENIASVYIKIGELKLLENRVAKHYKQALNIRQSIYESLKSEKGEENECTLKALNNVALTCIKLGDWHSLNNREEAVKHYEEALNIRKIIFESLRSTKGEEDERTLKALNNVALPCIKLGDWHSLNNREEAVEHYEEALNIRKIIFESLRSAKGEEDERTLNALNNVALTCIKLGKLHSLNNREEAVKHYEEALNIRKIIFESLRSAKGEEDERTLKALTNVAYMYYTISCMESQNNPKTALQYCNELIDYNTILLNNYKKLFDKNSEQVKNATKYLDISNNKRESLLKELQMICSWR